MGSSFASKHCVVWLCGFVMRIWTSMGPKYLECGGVKRRITKTTQEKEGSTFNIKNVDKENDKNSKKYTIPLLPL